jgi:hypothetical protein
MNMKKVISLFLVMMFVTSVAFAGNWVVGTEGSQVEMDIESTTPIALGYSQVYTSGDFTDVDYASGSLVSSMEDVKLTQYLASIGYQVSDTFRPYILLGTSSLEYDWSLSGSAVIGESETWTGGSYNDSYSIGGNILNGSFEDNGVFTYGLGITGDIKDIYEGIVLSYDVRNVRFEAKNNGNVCILPDLTDFGVNTMSEVEYSAWSAALILSKEFELKGKDGENFKFIKSLTPSVGYKYTNVSMNIKTDTSVPLGSGSFAPSVNIKTEQNIDANLNTLLVGVKAQVNDNWAVSINGMVGDIEGIGLKTTYSF